MNEPTVEDLLEEAVEAFACAVLAGRLDIAERAAAVAFGLAADTCGHKEQR